MTRLASTTEYDRAQMRRLRFTGRRPATEWAVRKSSEPLASKTTQLYVSFTTASGWPATWRTYQSTRIRLRPANSCAAVRPRASATRSWSIGRTSPRRYEGPGLSGDGRVGRGVRAYRDGGHPAPHRFDAAAQAPACASHVSCRKSREAAGSESSGAGVSRFRQWGRVCEP